jgi:hypothetical protein
LARTILPPNLRKARPSKLENITIRGWGGGWNAIQDDVSMPTDFLVTGKNFIRTPSKSLQVRYGSKWFVDLTGTITGTRIVDMTYFNNRLVCVSDTGQIATVNDAGVKTKIWDSAIAALLPGTPSGWSNDLDSIDFVPFRNTLIVHNGVDKPITIDDDFAVTYLQDLATGSNVNTPIGRYGCTVSNYHCIAGIDAEPTSIYISSAGTSGTFVGDPAPNDGITIDIGAYAPEGSEQIRGIAGFRSFLLVFFLKHTLVIQLGVYDGTTHDPQFPDAMPKVGLLGHRTMLAPQEKDIIFSGFDGTASAAKNLFSGTMESEFISALIDPEYRKTVFALTDEQKLKSVFCVYDPSQHSYELHTPSGRIFTYCFLDDPRIKYEAWMEGDGPVWDSACTTLAGRVFLASGLRLFQRGNSIYAGEDYSADKILDRDENWANNTAYVVGDLVYDTDTEEVYECLEDHTSEIAPTTFAEDRAGDPSRWELYEGLGIEIEAETPWIDGRNPFQKKKIGFARVGSKGYGEFTLKAYVDNLYKGPDGTVDHDPALALPLTGNDAYGFGGDSSTNYGGGRQSADPRLMAFPVKFKMVKFVITGSIKAPLTISSLGFLFSRGSY